ncbi:MAG TPA: toll/interleukin-1 receptor domain-containing protein [Hyphomonadaceae bacterium]|jgi:hypothetical protein|nr:toll/interleukin-1 receptor domain-containing protein [Hyphomonadaceae bacterium]
MKYDIFVSYRRSDRELVASVVRRLEARGMGVWYDADIEGGADWREKIVDALTDSEMLTIFFSEDCNNSRQLKKELAVADSLGKPVIPILIENTAPRGAFLYELADRNWIEVFPEPMDRINELVDHLAILAGKGDGGAPVARLPKEVSRDPETGIPIKSPTPANDVLTLDAPKEAPPEKLVEAVEQFIEKAENPQLYAPKAKRAYIGRVTDPGPIRKMNDVPPFRWFDLAVIIPIFLAALAYVLWQGGADAGDPATRVDRFAASVALYGILGTALYGSVAFPVRYYLRRRGTMEALVKYLGSAAMLFVAAFGVVLAGLRDGYLTGGDLSEFLKLFGVAWVLFAVIAFVTYGVMAGRRAMNSFRSNIKKI